MDQFDDLEAEEATQQTQESTQPHSSRIDSQLFSNVLCLLIPLSNEAKSGVRRLYTSGYHSVLACTDTNNRLFSSSTSTERKWNDAYEKASMEGVDLDKLAIALRRDPGPKNPEVGFTFGRNYKACDVCLGGMSKLSNIHFRIKLYEESQVLVLEDISTNGTLVDDVRVISPNPDIPRRTTLNNGAFIKLFANTKEEIVFAVRVFPENLAEFGADTGMSMDENMGGRIMNGFLGPNRKYECLNVIGQGSFAVVWKGIERETGKTVAVKQIKKRGSAKSAVQKEVEIMEKLDHENIIKFYEHFEDDQYLAIILEFIPKGDLREFQIRRKYPYSEFEVKTIAFQVLKAIDYLHCRGITHRDLKPENILVSNENPLTVKLTDFGLAKAITNDQSFLRTFCGTMLYLAPEAFPPGFEGQLGVNVGANVGEKRKRGEDNDETNERPVKKKHSYSQSIDIWALGCILYSLMTEKHPFECGDKEDTLLRIGQGNFDQELLESKSKSPVDCIDFIGRMLNVEPALRIHETEALRHCYLQEAYRESSASPAPSSINTHDYEAELEDLSRLSQDMYMGMGNNSLLGSEHATLRPVPRPSQMEGSLHDSFDYGGNATSRAGSPCDDDDDERDFDEAAIDLNSQDYQIRLQSQVADHSNGSPMDSQQNPSPMPSQQNGSPMDSQQNISSMPSQQNGSPMDSQPEIDLPNSQRDVSVLASLHESNISGYSNFEAPSILANASDSGSGSESNELGPSRGNHVGLDASSIRDSSLSISDLRGSDIDSAYSNNPYAESRTTSTGPAHSAYPSSTTFLPFQTQQNINSSQISDFHLESSRDSSRSDRTAERIDSSQLSTYRRDTMKAGSSNSSMESGNGSTTGSPRVSPTDSEFLRPSLIWGSLSLLPNSIEGKPRFNLTKRLIGIGRNPKSEIALKSQAISRKHVALNLHDPLFSSSQQPDGPIERCSRLICHVKCLGRNPCKLNGEYLPLLVPCRIFDGDELVLVDEDKLFIGYKCKFNIGSHQRPPNVPNIIRVDSRGSTPASPTKANKSSDSGRSSSEYSGLSTRECSPKATTAPISKRRLISNEEKEASKSGGGGSKPTTISTIKRKLITTAELEKEVSDSGKGGSLKESTPESKPTTTIPTSVLAEEYLLTKSRRIIAPEPKKSTWSKIHHDMSASSLKKHREKGKVENLGSPLSISTPQRAKMEKESSKRASPSRPKQQVVRLEDRDDLGFNT